MSPSLRIHVRMLAGAALLLTGSVQAGGGYFALGYGPLARQMAGATTAVTGDAYAGSSNPAKLLAAGDRLDLGLELFMPRRRIEREGSGTVHDFHSHSRNTVFPVPEGAWSRQLGDDLALGVTVYGNGGLNTEYNDTTGVPGTNFNPAECGARDANFLFGCGRLGSDLMQLVVAPTLAWRPAPRHGLGLTPLIVLQRFEAYGLQAFAPLSAHPDKVTNKGKDTAFGAGLRIGWLGEMTPWLTLGAAYATRVYMQDFDDYRGLFAEGSFDIPENFSLGLALRPHARLTLSFDFQRINYAAVPALGNGVLNSLADPAGRPLGSREGSGFNWRNQNNYKVGVAFALRPELTLRAGYVYGRRPNDDDINSVSFNLLTPNPRHQASVGLSWQPDERHELHLAVGHFFKQTYEGPSASALIGVGGREKIEPYVTTLMVAWSRRL